VSDAAAFEESVRAHLSGEDVDLRTETVRREDAPDAAAFASALEAYKDVDEAAWLDAQLHLTTYDPKTGTATTRVLPATANRAALHEEIGVIVRGALSEHTAKAPESAVAEGASGAEPVAPPGEALPNALLRIEAGYVGTTYADAFGWTNGGRAAAAYPLGSWLLGAEYALFPTVSAPTVSATSHLDSTLTRHAFGPYVGYEVRNFGRTGLFARTGGAFELAAIVETAVRGGIPRVPGSLPGSDQATTWTAGAGPRARVFWRPLQGLRIFLRGGADFVAPSYDEAVGPNRSISATPHLVRVRGEAGLDILLW
jgi:hypothetical protein